MAQSKAAFKILQADRLIDSSGGAVRRDVAVVLEGELIKEILPRDHLDAPVEDSYQIVDFPGATILPGLIDCHTHTNMPANGRRGEEVIPDGDDLRLLRSAQNCRIALQSGVTTMCDNGAWNNTAFSLKEGLSRGVVEGPRLMACGRPITTTGGHCWFMGSEADGVDGVRSETRRLIKEGADFIKVMATGGSTLTSDPYRPAYTVEELRTVAEEAHRRGIVATAHCRCTEGMVNVLDADFDVIIHAHFAGDDGARTFDPRVAERIEKQGVWVNPTLHIGRCRMWQLREKRQKEGLSQEETELLERVEKNVKLSLEECRQLNESGVKLVAGSDCGWGTYPFGRFAQEIGALVEAGLTPMEAILAGTKNGAEALHLLDRVGSVEAGKQADLLVVDGDPSQDITALERVLAVYKAGKKVDA